MSGTVTSRAEFAPMTELNRPTNPHAKAEVEVLLLSSMTLSVETPPLAVVAQMTTAMQARGVIIDLTVKTWRIWVV